MWQIAPPRANVLIFNSLIPGRSGYNFKNAYLNFVLLVDFITSSYGDTYKWMPQEITDDKSTLVQVMASCHQATSHYLNKCWSSSMMPYGIIRPQWVKHFHMPGQNKHNNTDNVKNNIFIHKKSLIALNKWNVFRNGITLPERQKNANVKALLNQSIKDIVPTV